MGALNIIVK